MPAKRMQPLGTRRLTERALRAAFNEAQQVVSGSHRKEDAWLYDRMTPAKWYTILVALRTVEHHAILLQQRGVYAVAKKIDPKLAARLARKWTILKEA